MNLEKYSIGSFGDKRLDKAGASLFNQICDKKTVILRQLASCERAKEVQYGRFLSNEKVTISKMNAQLISKTNENCLGIEHVLCINDTVESTYPNQNVKKELFGNATHQDTKGFFTHGSVILNAKNKEILGAGVINSWHRVQNSSEGNKVPCSKRPIEEKESYKWIECAQSVKKNLIASSIMTFVSDRESDVIEYFDQIPDEKTEIIVRACHDRILDDNAIKLSQQLALATIAGTIEVHLPRNRKRKNSRKAILEIRYINIELPSPSDPGKVIKLSCIQAIEVGKVRSNEDRISWVLLTTHKVSSISKASQILTWYTWRWTIEEIHRIMKNKGQRIEDSQIEKPNELLKLSVLCFASAVKTMMLVNARDGNVQKATVLFSTAELMLLSICCKKIQGETKKQKNKFQKNTMGWAAWIIARLGGWKGYKSESPPGPMTMHTGLESFYKLYEGWSLAREICA